MSCIAILSASSKNQRSSLSETAAATPMRLALGNLRNIGLALAVLLLGSCGAAAQSSFGALNVGASATLPVSVSAQLAGTVNSVQVLTAGASGLDFMPGGGASTCQSTLLAVGQACTVSVTFTPAYPGERLGAVVLLDGNDKVLGTAFLSGTGLGGLGVLIHANMISVAGVPYTFTSTQDGVLATIANLWQPSAVTLDGAGNMYIADSAHNRIRKVSAPVPPATVGIISTIAGSGDSGYAGDGQAAISAKLSAPDGVALDGAGNLYIADTGNNVVRMVTPSTGIITTVAGTGNGGYAGDGQAATAAELNQPWGVTVDAGGNLYIADTFNQRVRRVDLVTGTITTVAGNGLPSPKGNGKGTYSGDGGKATLAGLSLPYALAIDLAGNMYIADSDNNRVRKVDTSGIVTTYAGSANNGYKGDGDAATSAWLHLPTGVALDAAGNLYIADTQNAAIRKVNAATGIISTLAVNGLGTTLNQGVLGPVILYAPIGLFVDGAGNVYLSDHYNMLVLEIEANQAVLDFTANPVRQGDKSSTKNQTVENDGNAALDLTSITPDANAALDGATTTCNTGAPTLAMDADCVIGAVFAPSPSLNLINPTLETGNIDIVDPAANSPLDIELIGDATAVNSTTTVLTSSLNPSNFGQGVTFSATVTTGAGTGSLTGTVTFTDGGTVLVSNVALNAAGVATYATPALAVGPHSIVASYSGDLLHFASDSNPALIQMVDEVTATALTTSGSPSALNANVTFTATVTDPNAGGIAPDGTVTFTDGATILGSVSLNGAGVASYSTTTLPQGLNAIQASYSGDAAKDVLASASAILNQDVQAASTSVVSSSLNPSNFGDSVTFTATVTAGGSLPAAGVVNFLDGGKQIGTANLAGNPGVGTFTTSSLTAGPHVITVFYQGTPNTAGSTSVSITQTVNKTTPVITWPLPAAITYGTALGVAQLDASANVPGVLVYTPGTGVVLAAGAQTLSVTFTPTDAADYNGVTATVPLTVNKAAPTLVVSTSGTPAPFASAVTFTATISSGPTGTVTFYDAGSPIGSGALNGTLATFTTSTLAVGSHTISASWIGNGNFNSITSSAITQVVIKATPSIAWATPAPIVYGTALSGIQLDATTAPAGVFVYTPALGAILSAGSHTLSVTFTPTDTTDYNPATATVTLLVNQATSTLTWPAPAPIVYGTPLGAAQLDASSGGVAGNLVYTPPAGTVLGAGLQTLSVTFTPTDTTDYSVVTATVQLTVNKATPTLAVATSGTPSNYGGAVTFTATASSGPTGTVTFNDGVTSIGTAALSGVLATFTTSSLAAGVHTITASWPGNNNFNAVTSSPITQTVNPAQTSTGVAAAPNPGIAGLSVAITATVKVVAGSAPTTGTVVFTNGSATLGSATLSGGTATINPVLAAGSYSIVATYSGDANDGVSASAPFALTVLDATTSTTVASSQSSVLVLTPVTYTAKVTGNGVPPTGSVSFLADGTSIGAANLDATGTATLTYAALSVGSHQITASYAGDADNSPSTSSAVTEVVAAISTVTALGASTTTGSTQQTILVAAVLGASGPTPTGTVTFMNGSTTIGSSALDSSGVATLTPNLPNGSYSLVAAYGGDALHSPSTSNTVTITNPAMGFSLSVQPTSVTMATTQNATVAVTITSNTGFTDKIGLGCASLPSGVTCHFASQSVALASNATQTVQLTIDTNSPLSGGSSAMNTHAGSKGVFMAGLLLPFSLFFGWTLWLFRKRHAAVFTAAIVVLLGGAALLTTGCSGFTQSSAAPGTYVIQVVGVGADSNITHYENVTVTITGK